jgi:hypothetical protein
MLPKFSWPSPSDKHSAVIGCSPCQVEAGCIEMRKEFHMITTVLTANIHDGKMQEAFALAQKATKYMNEKFGTNMQINRNVNGPLYQVHFVTMYDSLAAFEKTRKQFEADAGYHELLAEIRNEGVFIGTSIVQNIYETV